jgi:DDE domain
VEAAGAAPSYKGFRFPAEIISHAVWLYHRFPLSFREVEELLLARGITVSHETVRQWCDRFGPEYAAGLRRRRPQAGDKWHLDEVFIKVNGVWQYLWRAVDQDGNVLDTGPVQEGREGREAVHGQAHEEAAPGTQSAGHRQVPLLRAGSPGTDELGGTPLAQGAEQPGGELSSAHTRTRAANALIQVVPAGTAIPVGSRHDQLSFPTPASSAYGHSLPCRTTASLWHLEFCSPSNRA